MNQPDTHDPRYPLRQLRSSIRANRAISWPTFRRLALRSGLNDTRRLQATWQRDTRRRVTKLAG